MTRGVCLVPCEFWSVGGVWWRRCEDPRVGLPFVCGRPLHVGRPVSGNVANQLWFLEPATKMGRGIWQEPAANKRSADGCFTDSQKGQNNGREVPPISDGECSPPIRDPPAPRRKHPAQKSKIESEQSHSPRGGSGSPCPLCVGRPQKPDVSEPPVVRWEPRSPPNRPPRPSPLATPAKVGPSDGFRCRWTLKARIKRPRDNKMRIAGTCVKNQNKPSAQVRRSAGKKRQKVRSLQRE